MVNASSMDEDMKNPLQLVKEVNECLKDVGPEPAYKMLTSYIEKPDFKVAPVYGMAAIVCNALMKQYAVVDKELYEYYLIRGYRFAKAGNLVDESNATCAKYFAVLIDARANFKGLYKWIVDSVKMKTAWLKALELNPGDPAIHRELGIWCYIVADWTWMERKVASAIFDQPPTSTFQEALKYFLEAEGKHSKSWAMTSLWIARCYIKLNKFEAAREYLKECISAADEVSESEQIRREALGLFNDFNMENQA
ncbi:hypothetical protein PHET_10218 [Paragonimus heterotremus]|uniref:Regulator of microtubule dynamics protein 1 n=1 Tax=Paragonimus heterotremus TaxID=100268 RepID=A0A8J4WEA0_9TREM|nr:hypothetical protein PHET_10218 [Paragonimus heterotremus]